MASLLSIKDITLAKGDKKILDHLSMEVWEGHIHAIVGPNGAGKSTLAYAIMGLSGYRNFSGDIIFQGKPINKLSVTQRARLGLTLAWQEPARFEGLKVRQYLESSGVKDQNRVKDAMERVGLEPSAYLDRAVDSSLSGGERKRIELAAIIVMRPKLVILDEPDSGIDVEAVGRIFKVFTYLKEQGTTVILITHSPDVMRRADHAFLVCHGRMVDKGEMKEVYPFFLKQCAECDHPNEPEVDR